MSQAVVQLNNQSKALLTEEDIKILRDTKFRKFEDHEIAYASKICTLLRLNPLLNQIHFVKRKNKDGTYSITAQVGIDGFRLTAMRAGGYAGSDEPVFETSLDKKKPLKATVTVYRIVEGQKCSFTASARWDEYTTGEQMWQRMPFNQLAKCAEALALRKAFPAELSALRTDEEMDQADRPNKASELQSKIAPAEQKPEPKDVQSEVSNPAPEVGAAACQSCGSTNLMVSRYHEKTHYCKDCKKTQPMGAA
jgi:phage recombination protein Bet